MRTRIVFEIDRGNIRYLSADFFEKDHYLGGFTYLSKRLAEFVKYSKNERRYKVTSDLTNPIVLEFLRYMLQHADVVIEYLQNFKKEVSDIVPENR